jgi:glycosyltransferase involved in cell wall biosynthesis
MKNIPINVCLVAPLPPPYGGISHWAALLIEFSRKDSGVHIEVVDIAPRWRAIYSRAHALRILGGGIQMVRDLLRLTFILSSAQFDAIHLTTPGHLALVRDILFALIAKIFGVKLIYHIHYGRIPELAVSQCMEWRILNFVMRQASKIVVLDDKSLQTIKGVLPNLNVVIIPNCMSGNGFEEPKNNKEGAGTVLFAGWVIPSKGVDELIQSWGSINLSGWRLKIIGPGDLNYRSYLLEKYRPKNIEFLGELSHTQAMLAMKDCSIFVLPSHTEAFPYVILEAMFHGCAIVASDVGAIPEMLKCDSGLLVQRANVKELANALIALMQNDDMRNKFGKNAFIRAKELYTIEAVYGLYKSLWIRGENV